MEQATILVGTDFSEGARAALLHARALAEQLGGRIHLVHIFDPPGGIPAELDDAARRWLVRCEVELTSLATRRGTAWLELAREARSLDASMIVIGRHGQSGYQPIELGSTAARLGLAAHCPVLLVGDRLQGRLPQRVWMGSVAARPVHL